MQSRTIYSGSGWRLGCDPEATDYPGLVGSDDWAIELTAVELQEFCQLFARLVDAVIAITPELMDEENIDCELETDKLWMQVSGTPQAFCLRAILQTGRRCELNWSASATSELFQATKLIDLNNYR
jgi:hypothetical protein